MQVRNPVREIRLALSVEQEDMAKMLGCDVATIQRCEAEHVLPQEPAVVQKLSSLASGVGMQIDDLGLQGMPSDIEP